jgi:hypothetical protein
MLAEGQVIWGFELGNEVNNRANSCSLQPAQQAAAFALFKTEVLERLYPDRATRPKLIGPDVGFLHPQAWLGARCSSLIRILQFPLLLDP